jgi:hypothetical protein
MAARSTMDADQIRRAITRLGHEIVERNGGTDDLVLSASVPRSPAEGGPTPADRHPRATLRNKRIVGPS